MQMGDDGRLVGLVAGLEPGAFRSLLELALRHERDGERRQAAATFRTALGAIPRALPMSLRSVLDHAKAVVEANDADRSPAARAENRRKTFAAAEDALAAGFMVTGMKYNDQERVQPAPSLRVNVKSEMNTSDLEALAKAISKALHSQFE